MISKYDYGKDIRTDEEYREYNVVGKYNQDLCIKQYITDKFINENKFYNFIWQPEKDFAENDNEVKDYQPDYILIVDDKEYALEIKVQMVPLNHNIHIKYNQIKKLIEMGGFVLLSTKDRYFIHSARYLLNVSNGIIFSNKLFSKCIDIEADKVTWINWLHKPKYKEYPRINGKYTRK